MFILLFVCWIIFNQNLTLEIVIFGLAVCGAVYFFVCRFMDYSVKKDIFIMSRLPGIILYVITLVWEIVKANVVLVGIMLFKKNRRPVIVEFHTKIRSRIGRSLLANSITLTPGTITAAVEGNFLRIHCFDESLAKGLDATVFEKRILKLEEGYEDVIR